MLTYSYNPSYNLFVIFNRDTQEVIGSTPYECEAQYIITNGFMKPATIH